MTVQPIQVQTLVGPAVPALIAIRQPSEAERKLRCALRIAKAYHTYSVAQIVGVYPA